MGELRPHETRRGPLAGAPTVHTQEPCTVLTRKLSF
jgi:hypothetical protein